MQRTARHADARHRAAPSLTKTPAPAHELSPPLPSLLFEVIHASSSCSCLRWSLPHRLACRCQRSKSRRPALRRPIRASASSLASTTLAKPAWNMRLAVAHASRPRSSRRASTPISPSSDTMSSRAASTASRSGTSPDPSHPTLRTSQYCPASQSDVSVYKNLLVVSSESNSGRLDCGDQGIKDTVSAERIRGVRLFDISDLDHPKYITNVQTCRGSHTHSLLVDPKDTANVYVYISGSSPLRSPKELAGCTSATPDKDPNSALMRLEVITDSARASGESGGRELGEDLRRLEAAQEPRRDGGRQHRRRTGARGREGEGRLRVHGLRSRAGRGATGSSRRSSTAS